MAFDNYDAIGHWRTVETVHAGTGEDPKLDPSGELYDGRTFKDAKELKKILLDDTDKFAIAFTEKLATYALRRGTTFSDRAELRHVTEQAKADDYKLASLIESFVDERYFSETLTAPGCGYPPPTMPNRSRHLILALACLAAAQVFAAPAPDQSAPTLSKEKRRLVLCNDGGTLGAPDMEAPIGIEGLVHETIDPLRDTMVDTLYWQIGVDPWLGTDTHRLSDWYSHRTHVGAIWGSDRDKFKTAGEWRIAENARQLVQDGTDSAAVAIDYGHKAGLDVFLSLRFNDGHDSRLKEGLNDANMVPTRRNHPDWLLGGEGFSKFGYNFAVPEVRAYTLALIKEAIANYDLDGFDLDFDRQPTVFKPGEGEKNAALITDILRQTRIALEARGEKLGRKLFLSVRVPPSLAYDRQQGLDVPAWIKERLVDIVVVGDPGGWNYRLPIEEFHALAQGTGCKILAQNLCAFKEDRGRSASVLFGERDYYSTEQFRAVAAQHWQAGADGMYIWNQHWLKYYRDDKFDRQSWKEIGDPQVLAHKDKYYIVGPEKRGGPLPLNLAHAGDAHEDQC